MEACRPAGDVLSFTFKPKVRTSTYVARGTPAGRGKRKKNPSPGEPDQTPTEKRVSNTWVKRLTAASLLPDCRASPGTSLHLFIRWWQGFLRPDVGMVATSIVEETDSRLQQVNSATRH